MPFLLLLLHHLSFAASSYPFRPPLAFKHVLFEHCTGLRPSTAYNKCHVGEYRALSKAI